MSNFIVWWGIPFLLFWLVCVYRFAAKNSYSIINSLLVTIIIVLVLQGEQFLNFPIFLMFFTAPAIKIAQEKHEEEEEEEEFDNEYELSV